MPQRTLGTLTIGQAPRPDVVPIIDRHVPAVVRRVHVGQHRRPDVRQLRTSDVRARFARYRRDDSCQLIG